MILDCFYNILFFSIKYFLDLYRKVFMRKFLSCFIAFLFMFQFIKANDLKISVSIPPLYFFVKEIAKTHADITIIVPQNKNPEIYEPSFQDMKALSNSDIFIGIGMPFESIWLPKIIKANKQQESLTILALDKELKKIGQMHLWFSIKNAKEITNIITKTLSAKDPKNAKFYSDNAKLLLQSLDNLDTQIKAHIQNMPKKDFIVYHPLLDSASAEYGLIEHALEQHGRTYGMKEILALSNFGRQAQIKRVFTEHANKDIATLANSMNAKVVLINPMSKDYLNNLLEIFIEISKSYEE